MKSKLSHSYVDVASVVVDDWINSKIKTSKVLELVKDDKCMTSFLSQGMFTDVHRMEMESYWSQTTNFFVSPIFLTSLVFIELEIFSFMTQPRNPEPRANEERC